MSDRSSEAEARAVAAVAGRGGLEGICGDNADSTSGGGASGEQHHIVIQSGGQIPEPLLKVAGLVLDGGYCPGRIADLEPLAQVHVYVHPDSTAVHNRDGVEAVKIMMFNSKDVTGQKNPQSKLTDLQRACIAECKGIVSQQTLAKIHGVSPSAIRDVWSREKRLEAMATARLGTFACGSLALPVK